MTRSDPFLSKNSMRVRAWIEDKVFMKVCLMLIKKSVELNETLFFLLP